MDPLQDLKDIHLPKAIDSWPPAYGWWILALLTLLALYVTGRWLYHAHKKRLAKRQAVHAVQLIDVTCADSLAKLNQLLKRAASHYFAGHNVQQLFGQQWQSFLQACLSPQQAQRLGPTLAKMQQALYQAQPVSHDEIISYQQACKDWLNAALPPSHKRLKQLEQSHA